MTPTISPVEDLTITPPPRFDRSPDVTTIGILRRISRDYPAGFATRLWTGECVAFGSAPAAFTLVLKHPGALRAMLWSTDKLGLGESYIFDDCDIEGDIVAFCDWLAHLIEYSARQGMYEKLQAAWDLGRLPDRKNPRDSSKAGRPTGGQNTREGDREGISYTYDVPGDFYKLFLDRNLAYSCSYFETPDDEFEASQVRKLHYICRKLRLKPGDRFVDVGCGWGSLLLHAAKYYGVEAVGVTLAKEQARWVERAVAEAGLTDRVQVVISDYRDFNDPFGFDKAASISMAEHVGVKNLPVYMGSVFRNLRPGGVYMHHSITLRPNTPYPVWTPFSLKYVFPNGELQTIVQVLAAAAEVGFEVRDVENLREHYTITLGHWVKHLEANREKAIALIGEVSYRIFRLYIAAATMSFKDGVTALDQCLLLKPLAGGRSGLPLTRNDWYD